MLVLVHLKKNLALALLVVEILYFSIFGLFPWKRS